MSPANWFPELYTGDLGILVDIPTGSLHVVRLRSVCPCFITNDGPGRLTMYIQNNCTISHLLSHTLLCFLDDICFLGPMHHVCRYSECATKQVRRAASEQSKLRLPASTSMVGRSQVPKSADLR